MFKNILKVLGGDPDKKEIERLSLLVEQINALEGSYEALSDEALRAKTDEFRQRLAEGETLDDLAVEAFAAVREAGKRTIGLRHYDVQMIGGMVLHEGKIAEMRTGEGKTLVATLPLYLNALDGKGAHLVTVNDYLARRDARWMAPIYNALGLSVGVLQMTSHVGGGPVGYLVDLSKTSSQEDQHQLVKTHRRDAYAADITYGTNHEYGFDYLRDNLTMSLADRVQRGHHFAIVDEVDNILIDEARTPLIISGPAQDESENYNRMSQIVRQLVPEDYEIDEKDRTVTLTEIGEVHVEQLLGVTLRDPDRPEDITPEQARTLGYLEQALRAQHLYRRNKDYLVQGGNVVIVDEFTGRLMPGRRWSEGLHQAVEAKEGVKVHPENITYATITLQNYFRMYKKLSGMTGTAATEAEELAKIYKLDVLPIPTNLEFQAQQTSSELKQIEDRDEQGYKYIYYAKADDVDKRPVYWKRKDYPDVVYRSTEAKLRAIVQEIIYYFVLGRPQLVGTTSVEYSEIVSGRLSAEPVRRLLQTLLIRDAWMRKNNVDIIERSIPELELLNSSLLELKANDLRPLARTFDMSVNPEDPQNVERLKAIFGFSDADEPRLMTVLQAGVPHAVLNARKHDEEAGIIARAGAFGAVTIATNMAGRGVDIKLGGELPEDTLRDVNRVLGKVSDDPFNLNNEERYRLLQDMTPDQYGIYEEAVNTFKEYIQNMHRVRQLGGLHVIGSERHEARRIDNQLRGRAARQGDPGSSRFYLSLEDELMRLFGGDRVESLWKGMKFEENQPIEMNILGRMVEQAQERVEGSNFDVRKHLLEYDDVLNSQRARIYSQRDMVFVKEDLTEDVLDMLHIELERRIPEALRDEEGPWKLLSFLNDIQPSIEYQHIYYPAFTLQLLFDEFEKRLQAGGLTIEKLRAALLELAASALEAEREHLLRSATDLVDKMEQNIHRQQQERLDAVDTFLEGLREGEEEGAAPRKPQDLLNELINLVHLPVRLNNEQLRQLSEGDPDVGDEIRRQVESAVIGMNLVRLIGALERRLEESLGVTPAQLQDLWWDEASGHILDALQTAYDARTARLLGADGQLARDLEPALAKLDTDSIDPRQLIPLLNLMSQGSRTVFDARTHKRASQRYTRFSFVYLAARSLAYADPAQITTHILEHIEGGLQALQQARGLNAWNHLVTQQATLQQLEAPVKKRLAETLGEDKFAAIAAAPLPELGEDERAAVCDVLGWHLQNEACRHLLLRVISDQWVDYLTNVEALRISIRLEAYAQKDPLVEYKGRATEMFQNLLAEIRMGVVSRLFTYNTAQRVSAAAASQAAPAETDEAQPAEVAAEASSGAPVQTAQPRPVQQQAADSGGGGKRHKRHKKR